MKTNLLIAAVAAMLLQSCMVRFNGKNSGATPAASTEEAMTNAAGAAAKGFTRIEAYGSYDIYYMQDSATAVRLEGDTACIRRTAVKCDGTTLKIYEAAGNDFFNDHDNDVDIYITSPSLTGVSMYGSGDFTTKGAVTTSGMAIAVGGSGDIRFDGLNTGKLTVSVAGSGDVKVDRAGAKTVDASVAGSGDIGFNGVKTGKMTATIAGSGDIKVEHANIDKAECTVAGSGDIIINGRVGQCDRSVAGSGSVTVNN